MPLTDEFHRKLTEILGDPLSSSPHLQTALTHRSFVNENGAVEMEDNERLEFLGDAVLSLVVSEMLMIRYPKHQEGELSKFRSLIVNERRLAQAARELQIGTSLLLGKGEAMTGGREKDSILADAFEAIVAALYLDVGLETARKFVLYCLEASVVDAERDAERYDFKTALQELTQRLLGTVPSYRLANEDGPDHDKTFATEVTIHGRVYGHGQAKSKKMSEQHAADEALRSLREQLDQGAGDDD